MSALTTRHPGVEPIEHLSVPTELTDQLAYIVDIEHQMGTLKPEVMCEEVARGYGRTNLTGELDWKHALQLGGDITKRQERTPAPIALPRAAV